MLSNIVRSYLWMNLCKNLWKVGPSHFHYRGPTNLSISAWTSILFYFHFFQLHIHTKGEKAILLLIKTTITSLSGVPGSSINLGRGEVHISNTRHKSTKRLAKHKRGPNKSDENSIHRTQRKKNKARNHGINHKQPIPPLPLPPLRLRLTTRLLRLFLRPRILPRSPQTSISIFLNHTTFGFPLFPALQCSKFG